MSFAIRWQQMILFPSLNYRLELGKSLAPYIIQIQIRVFFN